MLERELIPAWDGLKAAEITHQDALDVLDGITARGADVMANQVLGVMKRPFGFGVERGVLTATPVHTISRPGGKERPRQRVLSLPEISTTWRELSSCHINPQW